MDRVAQQVLQEFGHLDTLVRVHDRSCVIEPGMAPYAV
jgi:predicted Zn-dependent protease